MSKQEATATSETTRRGSGDLPLVDTAAEAVKQLIERGSGRGYITYDELNAALPQDKNSSEHIEDIMAMISEMGINVVEEEESEDTSSGANGNQTPATTSNKSEEELGRTDDHCRPCPAALQVMRRRSADRDDKRRRRPRTDDGFRCGRSGESTGPRLGGADPR